MLSVISDVCVHQAARACEKFACETAQRGCAQGATVNALGAGIGLEAETLEFADGFVADNDAAGIIELKIVEIVFA